MASQRVEDALERQGRIDPMLASIAKLEERVLALERRTLRFDSDAGRSARDDAIQALADLTLPPETPQHRYNAARAAVSERLNLLPGGKAGPPATKLETLIDALAQDALDLGYEAGYAQANRNRDEQPSHEYDRGCDDGYSRAINPDRLEAGR